MQDIYTTKQKINLHINNEGWAINIISNIWHELYGVWCNRCNELHDNENIEQLIHIKMQFKLKVEALYNQKYKLLASDQINFQRPIEEITKLPTHTIKAWLYTNTKFMKCALVRAKKQIQITKTCTTKILITTSKQTSTKRTSKKPTTSSKATKKKKKQPKRKHHISTRLSRNTKIVNSKQNTIGAQSHKSSATQRSDNAQFEPP